MSKRTKTSKEAKPANRAENDKTLNESRKSKDTTSGEAKAATAPATEQLKQHFTESLGLLKTLRDDICVQVHLAGMEAKEQWGKLETRFGDAEKIAHEASEASKRAFEEIVETFKRFRASLDASKQPDQADRPNQADQADEPAEPGDNDQRNQASQPSQPNQEAGHA